MKISIRVSVNSKNPRVLKADGDINLKVWVDAPAAEGKANKRLLEILSKHFGRPKSHFRIIRGLKSKNKTVELDKINGHER